MGRGGSVYTGALSKPLHFQRACVLYGCNEVITYRMKAAIHQPSGGAGSADRPWDGTAAGSELCLMMSLGLSPSLLSAGGSEGANVDRPTSVPVEELM